MRLLLTVMRSFLLGWFRLGGSRGRARWTCSSRLLRMRTRRLCIRVMLRILWGWRTWFLSLRRDWGFVGFRGVGEGCGLRLARRLGWVVSVETATPLGC